VVREFGSLGCSGDLGPAGARRAGRDGGGRGTGRRRAAAAAQALADAGLAPVVLAEKEGLALINGTDGMLAMLMLACADLDRLLLVADLAPP
jgi:histidine ammonia-lyase